MVKIISKLLLASSIVTWWYTNMSLWQTNVIRYATKHNTKWHNNKLKLCSLRTTSSITATIKTTESYIDRSIFKKWTSRILFKVYWSLPFWMNTTFFHSNRFFSVTHFLIVLLVHYATINNLRLSFVSFPSAPSWDVRLV